MIEIDSAESLEMDDVDVVMTNMQSQNKKVLDNFEEYLKNAGLTSKTISKLSTHDEA